MNHLARFSPPQWSPTRQHAVTRHSWWLLDLPHKHSNTCFICFANLLPCFIYFLICGIDSFTVLILPYFVFFAPIYLASFYLPLYFGSFPINCLTSFTFYLYTSFVLLICCPASFTLQICCLELQLTSITLLTFCLATVILVIFCIGSFPFLIFCIASFPEPICCLPLFPLLHGCLASIAQISLEARAEHVLITMFYRHVLTCLSNELIH